MVDRLLDPGVLALAIPILAILGGCGIVLSKTWIRHRERMAMIRMGMHPDHPEDFEEPYDADRPALGPGEPEEFPEALRSRESLRRR
jgi:hypothetical protein